MTVGLPNISDELKGLQVDPNHAAGVLAAILGSLNMPDVSPTSGLPSISAPSPLPSTDPFAATNVPTGTTNTTNVPPPTGTTDTTVTQPFEGEPPIAQPFHEGHAGIDFAVPVGSHMLAAISGTVTHAAGDDPGGYGNWVEITGANGISVRYGHLSQIGVQPGDTVTAGQVIGSSGGAAGAAGAGNSTGPHLHFEVRQNGNPVDPSPFLAGGAHIVGSAETHTNDAGVTTAEPLSPDQIISAQLTNVVDVVAGNQPNRQATRPVTPAAPKQQGLGTPNTPGTPGAASGNWATDILEGIGAPVTDENIRAMNAWMAAEGGAVHNNALNTTQDAEGATNWNDIGVKTYVSYEQGLAATIQTILNGRYGNIVAALRAGNSAQAVGAAVAASPWGTGDGLLRNL